jgi:hypothetical protein
LKFVSKYFYWWSAAGESCYTAAGGGSNDTTDNVEHVERGLLSPAKSKDDY